MDLKISHLHYSDGRFSGELSSDEFETFPFEGSVMYNVSEETMEIQEIDFHEQWNQTQQTKFTFAINDALWEKFGGKTVEDAMELISDYHEQCLEDEKMGN